MDGIQTVSSRYFPRLGQERLWANGPHFRSPWLVGRKSPHGWKPEDCGADGDVPTRNLCLFPRPTWIPEILDFSAQMVWIWTVFSPKFYHARLYHKASLQTLWTVWSPTVGYGTGNGKTGKAGGQQQTYLILEFSITNSKFNNSIFEHVLLSLYKYIFYKVGGCNMFYLKTV